MIITPAYLPASLKSVNVEGLDARQFDMLKHGLRLVGEYRERFSYEGHNAARALLDALNAVDVNRR